ncbi:unnamed protein product [Rotaria sp. Silwood2]|nr:unnamed protein product [Rotaria sp. Silwood2]CAF4169990.1 unnamed protein product [Rotaria sp. Silwood2]
MRDHGISREQFSNLISSFESILASSYKKTTSTDQWTREDMKCWFQQNHLSNHLINALGFINGSQLILYGKLTLDSTVRINEEYDRLRNKIGHDLFHLDEYVRFLDCLKTIVGESKSKQEQASCNIL